MALPPERHDALVAVVSHVPHLTAATLMRLADARSEEHRALLRLAAGGFRDMTRIAAGHPGIWPDICSENRAAIVDVLDELTAALGRHARGRGRRRPRGLLDALERARAARVNLPARLRTAADLREVRVPVPDRPGVVADVAILATDLDVNIVDLEIAHSTEGAQGVLVLLVEARRSRCFRAAWWRRGYRPSVHPVEPAGAMSSPTRSPTCRAVEPVDGPLDATVQRARVEEPDQPGAGVRGAGRGQLDARRRPGRRRHRGHGAALRALGAGIVADPADRGRGPAPQPHRDRHGWRPGPGPLALDVRLSGTTSRFLLPVVALGSGRYRLDGGPPLRARPMGPVLDGIRALGAAVRAEASPATSRSPWSPPAASSAGEVDVAGDTSSQFLSGLLLAAPYAASGMRLG